MVPPWDIGLSVRDLDGVILEETFLMFDYGVLLPGVDIGFVAPFFAADLNLVDQTDIRFTGSAGFDQDASLIDELAEATTEVESDEVIDLEDEIRIEYIVRNTSSVDYAGLNPSLAVWDANGLYCGSGYANVFAEIPAGDAIKFETISCCGSSNPVHYAGENFTWELWIQPVLA